MLVTAPAAAAVPADNRLTGDAGGARPKQAPARINSAVSNRDVTSGTARLRTALAPAPELLARQPRLRPPGRPAGARARDLIVRGVASGQTARGARLARRGFATKRGAFAIRDAADDGALESAEEGEGLFVDGAPARKRWRRSAGRTPRFARGRSRPDCDCGARLHAGWLINSPPVGSRVGQGSVRDLGFPQLDGVM